MPDDHAIKAALDAAQRATCSERCAFMGKPPCWEIAASAAPMSWPNVECDDPSCGALSAVAIAAFLRAYWPHRAPQGDLGPDLDELAAAVEAAANE